MLEAVPAKPVKPNTPATKAKIRNTSAQLNMINLLYRLKWFASSIARDVPILRHGYFFYTNQKDSNLLDKERRKYNEEFEKWICKIFS